MDGKIYNSKELLSQVLQNVSKMDRQKVGIYRSWEEIVGTKLSERSSIKDIIRNCLYISVRDGGTKQLLLLKKFQIISAISKKYPSLNVDSLEILFEKNINEESIFAEKESLDLVQKKQKEIDGLSKNAIFDLFKKKKEETLL